MALQRVETDAIQDDAITTAKIAPNAVAAADIAANAITNVKVATGAAIAVAKISGLGTAAALTAGTAANNVVQLDGSGRLPAISGVNLTGVSTDTSAMENNIAILAFKTQAANNLAKFNLIDQVVDEYKDATEVTLSQVGQVGSTAEAGYMATVYTATTTYNPSASSHWQGSSTGNATYGSGTVTATSGNKAIYTTNTFAGDFSISATVTAIAPGMWIGVWPTSEIATWHAGHEMGNMTYYTHSYFYASLSRASQTAGLMKGDHPANTSLQAYSSVDGDVVKIVRTGSTIYNYLNGTLKHTQTGVPTTDMKLTLGFGGSGSGNSTYTAVGWDTSSSATYATGTATSTANTALSAPTTGDICMLIENASGTATLNTDLKAYVSRNGGTGWDQATLVDKGSWGTNKKILTANNVAFSNSASGTDMRYKIEWANQASGSKVTRVHATSLAWA